MSDLVPPCDCAELVDGSWLSRCYCSNRDDGERTAAWCVKANHKAAADYDRCTIEFLRKEAAEQAAEIERLHAALRGIAKHSRGGVIDTTEKMDRDEFIGIARAAIRAMKAS